MKELEISFRQHEISYPIVIDLGLLKKIDRIIDTTRYSSVVVLYDKHVASIANALDIDNTPILRYQLPPGEAAKTIDVVTETWKTLLSKGLDRRSLIINVGGGAACDVGGFIAATYMRGIDFIQIPTTILAMVDASVGGKTAINFGGIKNSIGSFLQPRAVLMDITTLNTLPERERLSGWAEIIKHGLILDADYFRLVTAKKPSEYTSKQLIEIVYRSCYLKSLLVEADVSEAGPRKKLNFGHTLGHALESHSHEKTLSQSSALTHGEAIAIGMVGEAYLSYKLGYISESDFQTIESAIAASGLPIRYTSTDMDINSTLLSKMKRDKKNRNGAIKWTLLTAVGEADYNIEAGSNYISSMLKYILSPL